MSSCWCLHTPGSCPHSSWCDGILYNVFDFGSSDSTGASFANRAEILSANTVFDKIKSLGAKRQTWVVGVEDATEREMWA